MPVYGASAAPRRASSGTTDAITPRCTLARSSPTATPNMFDTASTRVPAATRSSAGTAAGRSVASIESTASSRRGSTPSSVASKRRPSSSTQSMPSESSTVLMAVAIRPSGERMIPDW